MFWCLKECGRRCGRRARATRAQGRMESEENIGVVDLGGSGGIECACMAGRIGVQAGVTGCMVCMVCRCPRPCAGYGSIGIVGRGVVRMLAHATAANMAWSSWQLWPHNCVCRAWLGGQAC